MAGVDSRQCPDKKPWEKAVCLFKKASKIMFKVYKEKKMIVTYEDIRSGKVIRQHIRWSDDQRKRIRKADKMLHIAANLWLSIAKNSLEPESTRVPAVGNLKKITQLRDLYTCKIADSCTQNLHLTVIRVLNFPLARLEIKFSRRVFVAVNGRRLKGVGDRLYATVFTGIKQVSYRLPGYKTWRTLIVNLKANQRLQLRVEVKSRTTTVPKMFVIGGGALMLFSGIFATAVTVANVNLKKDLTPIQVRGTVILTAIGYGVAGLGTGLLVGGLVALNQPRDRMVEIKPKKLSGVLPPVGGDTLGFAYR